LLADILPTFQSMVDQPRDLKSLSVLQFVDARDTSREVTLTTFVKNFVSVASGANFGNERRSFNSITCALCGMVYKGLRRIVPRHAF
jgi:hypothetical protein